MIVAGQSHRQPSYETIAERAHCGRTRVYQAVHALERGGILDLVQPPRGLVLLSQKAAAD
jgi:hypothetical protein